VVRGSLLVTLGPVVPGVGLEVERSELVAADDDVGIAGAGWAFPSARS
jgi:hypothetical protein